MKPNFRSLPNLSALRAFEAAARLENFSKAAEEIHLTHGAISHQIRMLEEDLGVQLFHRQGKRVSLTPDALRYAEKIRALLYDLERATDELIRSQNSVRLSITCLPSFAARWLAPRLGKFIEQNPSLEVNLHSGNQLVDFNRDSIDVGIRHGKGHYPGLHWELLMGDYFYPVVSPHYRGGNHPKTIEELLQADLLRSYDEPWTLWFNSVKPDLMMMEPNTGLVYEDSALLLRAAADGLGVALARHHIAQADIQAGHLVRLFDAAVPSPLSYYFVCANSSLNKKPVQLFRSWLLAEIAQLPEDINCKIA